MSDIDVYDEFKTEADDWTKPKPKPQPRPQDFSWPTRIHHLRHALGWTHRVFSKLSGIVSSKDIERQNQRCGKHQHQHKRKQKRKHYRPTIRTIRKIRRLETIFAKELAAYLKPHGRSRLRDRRPVTLTDRPKDLQALGVHLATGGIVGEKPRVPRPRTEETKRKISEANQRSWDYRRLQEGP